MHRFRFCYIAYESYLAVRSTLLGNTDAHESGGVADSRRWLRIERYIEISGPPSSQFWLFAHALSIATYICAIGGAQKLAPEHIR